MEYNLSSQFDTPRFGDPSVMRGVDLIEVAEHLEYMGYRVEPLDFRLDDSDDGVALPPYAKPHFKMLYESYPITSFGLIVNKT
jgi:hypothetical protein